MNRSWTSVAVAAAIVGSVGATHCSGTSGDTDAGSDAAIDALTCSSGTLACGSKCVSPETDPANCGSCGKACGATEVCSSGQCLSSCAASQSKCDTDAGAYCADFQTDNANCGACGKTCGVGEVCSNGTCSSTCKSGQTLCEPDGGAAFCATTSTDNANCGTCGHACGAGLVCSGGSCGTTCISGQTMCGTDAGADAGAPYCAALQTDNANCGACGSACPQGQTCVAGSCAVSCAGGLTMCGATCVDTTSDTSHCGSCGTTCGADQVCQNSACVGIIASWPFDPSGSTVDVTGHGYDGNAVNGPTPVIAYARDGLRLDGGENVALPAMDSAFTKTSFTVEAWINESATPAALDNPVFVECNEVNDECLHLTVRNSMPYFGFGNDDLGGATTLGLSTWYHVAWTFDASTKTQSIYVNGALDSTRTAASAFLGSGGVAASIGGPPPWQATGFEGIVDEVKVYGYARTPAQLLEDATALVKLPFDGNLFDVGPNHLWTSGTGYSFVPGEHGQGISFDGATTLVQAWRMTPFGISNQPFSFEGWINPTSTSAGVLFYASAGADGGGSCVPYLGFYNGTLTAHVFNGADDDVANAPTTPPTGTWTHVAETWSSATGLNLYVGGALVATTASANNETFSEPYLTLGSTSASSCGGGTRPQGVYAGAMDDVLVYARVRTAAEIAADATP